MPLMDEPIYRGTSMQKPETVVNGPKGETPEVPNQKASAEAKVNGDPAGSTNAVEIAKAQLMAQFATDPEISRILAARNSGKKVNIVDAEEQQQAAEPEQVDWDNLSNKDLVSKIPSVLGPTVDKLIKDATKPLMDELANLRQYAQTNQAEKVNQSVAAAKAKFQDFDTHRAKMVELNAKTNGSLSVEQLYWLAKAEAGDFQPPQPTATERPTNTSARPSLRDSRQAPLPSGKRGMAQMLDEALSRVNIEMEM